MFQRISPVYPGTARSSRVLGIETLENRIVPSGTPGTADLPAPDAQPVEPVMDQTVYLATSESPAIADGTYTPAQAGALVADPGATAATPALGLEIIATPAAKSSPGLLPSGALAADGYGGGSGDLPPTTSGIADVYVDEDAADIVIQLYSAFDDVEDGAENLTYELVGNTDPSLFNSVGIEGYGGLVLDFAPDAFGEAVLTVRATDTANQSVETSFTVHVAPVNHAPVISNFGGVQQLGDLWTFHGTVTDVDDPVQGMVVNFGGVLASFSVTATVEADGTFSLTREFLGLQSGTATAQTQDPHGAYSNEAWYEIVV